MKKKFLFVLLVMIGLLCLTGCGSSNNTKSTKESKKVEKKNKNDYVCEKKGLEDSSSVKGIKWEKDITYTAKLDKDGKLTYYSSLFHYMFDKKDDCDYMCDVKVKWNDEINANNYSGGHRETNCKCDKNEINEEYIYDDIENLASILRSDIKQLKADNTFDLDTWLEKYDMSGYKCK